MFGRSAHLRAYLKRLPGFQDIEAEAQALDVVGGHANVHGALAFLVQWLAHERAARMMFRASRKSMAIGTNYWILPPQL